MAKNKDTRYQAVHLDHDKVYEDPPQYEEYIDDRQQSKAAKHYPQQDRRYPQQGSSYPQQGSSYPRQGSSYPQQGSSYPQQGRSYPQQGSSYPQQGSSYPQQGSSYPQQGSHYPQQGRSQRNANQNGDGLNYNDTAGTRQQPTSNHSKGQYFIPPRPSPLNGPYCQNGVTDFEIPSPYFNNPPSYASTSQHTQLDNAGYTRSAHRLPQTGYRVDNSHIHSNQTNEVYGNQNIQNETRAVYDTNRGHARVQAERDYQDVEAKYFARHYMAWSWFNCLCCCIITGAAAIGVSRQVKAANFSGQYQEARKLSIVALVLNIVSLVAGLIILAVFIALKLTVAAEGSTRGTNYYSG